MGNSMSCKWDLWMVAVLVCVAVVLCEATGSDMVTTVNYTEGSPMRTIVNRPSQSDSADWGSK